MHRQRATSQMAPKDTISSACLGAAPRHPRDAPECGTSFVQVCAGCCSSWFGLSWQCRLKQEEVAAKGGGPGGGTSWRPWARSSREGLSCCWQEVVSLGAGGAVRRLMAAAAESAGGPQLAPKQVAPWESPRLMNGLSRRRVALIYLLAVTANIGLGVVAILSLESGDTAVGILAAALSLAVVVVFLRWTRRHRVTWPLPPRDGSGK
jgi:hypothetical protein